VIWEMLTNLVTVQAGLAIASPIAATVGHAYPVFPDAKITPPPRFFQNELSLGQVKPEQMVLTRPYQIRTQFLGGEMLADTARNEEIAIAFLEQYIEAVYAGMRAGGLFDGLILNLRGAEPTIGGFDRNGLKFVGFETFLTIDLTTEFNWGA